MTAVGYNEHSFHWRHSRWEFLSRGGWRRAKREEGGKTWALRILHVGSTSVRVRGLKWNGPPVGERETGRGNHTPDHPRTSAQKTWWSTWERWYAEGRETIAREGLFLDVKKGTKDFFFLNFASPALAELSSRRPEWFIIVRSGRGEGSQAASD